MRKTERVTVTLPADQAARLRRVAGKDGVASMSAYVSAAVSQRLDRDGALGRLAELYAERGVALELEHHAWAERVLGVGAGPAGEPAGDTARTTPGDNLDVGQRPAHAS
jgi:hypothetical protein